MKGKMDTEEELHGMEEREWDKFRKEYPTLTSNSLLIRFLNLHRKKVVHEVWMNGFLRGWLVRAELAKQDEK